MGLSTIYNKIALISPYVEIALRQLYWRNAELLKRFNPNKATSIVDVKDGPHVEFEKIIDWLKKRGIGKGSLLIVHSGYGELESTGLSTEQIIDRLLDLVGPTGTLAMPVIRRYKEVIKAQKKGEDWKKVICKYSVKNTMVSSGMLPYSLLQRKDATVSHHPLNPLCAVGPLAKAMMEHNLDGIEPSPHGVNSCWKFCYDHDVKVCSIGTSIEHHNTIVHIAEEAFGDWYWSDDIWYDRLQFEIVDEEKNSSVVTVRNRKEDWGKKHLAELKLCSDLKKKKIMHSESVDGITMGYVDPQKMVDYLKRKNRKGYPYFIFPWENPAKIR